MSTNDKHTPGPWRRENRHIGYSVRGLKNVAWVPTISSSDGNHTGMAEAAANARLIAAAPEMLAALRKIAEGSYQSMGRGPEWANKVARDAIAKAMEKP